MAVLLHTAQYVPHIQVIQQAMYTVLPAENMVTQTAAHLPALTILRQAVLPQQKAPLLQTAPHPRKVHLTAVPLPAAAPPRRKAHPTAVPFPAAAPLRRKAHLTAVPLPTAVPPIHQVPRIPDQAMTVL